MYDEADEIYFLNKMFEFYPLVSGWSRYGPGEWYGLSSLDGYYVLVAFNGQQYTHAFLGELNISEDRLEEVFKAMKDKLYPRKRLPQ